MVKTLFMVVKLLLNHCIWSTKIYRFLVPPLIITAASLLIVGVKSYSLRDAILCLCSYNHILLLCDARWICDVFNNWTNIFHWNVTNFLVLLLNVFGKLWLLGKWGFFYQIQQYFINIGLHCIGSFYFFTYLYHQIFSTRT